MLMADFTFAGVDELAITTEVFTNTRSDDTVNSIDSSNDFKHRKVSKEEVQPNFPNTCMLPLVGNFVNTFR